MLAARGARQLHGPAEAITEPGVIQQIRQQARRVTLRAILAALVLTALSVLIPV